jgi:hypothetical protein
MPHIGGKPISIQKRAPANSRSVEEHREQRDQRDARRSNQDDSDDGRKETCRDHKSRESE